MAYVYDNKTYRNLQQQVKENMDNIAELQDLKLVGIDVAGIVADSASLPSSAEQGQVYAVGSASPYELYVYNDSSWVDFGEFPKAGPKGDQGPQGEPGRQGPRGLTGAQGPRGYSGAPGTPGQAGPQGEKGPKGDKGDKGDQGLVEAFAKDASSVTAVGQAYVDANGYLQVCTSLSPLTFEQGGYIKGTKGDQGIQGPEGPQGEIGPEGPKGKKGDPSSIKLNGTTYTRDASGLITLPDYPTTTSELTNNSGFITNASLANYLERDAFKTVEWSRRDSDDSNTTHKLKLDLKYNSDDYILQLERYNNGSRIWGTHMTELGLFVFKDTESADTIHSILSWDSLKLSDLSQNVTLHTDHISINDTKNIPYADIATVSQIPTKTSQLTNNSGFVRGKDLLVYATKDWVEEQGYATKTALRDGLVTKQDTISDLAVIRSGAKRGDTAVQPATLSKYAKTSELATVATTGSYNDLTDKPAIPTKTSQLTNDSNFVTSTELATKQDKLVAGTNITIKGNVISATGGGSGGGSGGEIFVGTSTTSKSDWDAAYLANKQLYLERSGVLAPLGLTIGGSETVAPTKYFFSGFGNGTYGVCYEISSSGFSQRFSDYLQVQLRAGEGISIIGDTISATGGKNKYNVYLYDNSITNKILASKLIETSFDLTQGQQTYDISLSDLYNALLEDETGNTKSINNPILFNFTINPEFEMNTYSGLNDIIELTAYMDRNSGQYSYYKRRVSFSGQSIGSESIDDVITSYFTLKAEKVINN